MPVDAVQLNTTCDAVTDVAVSPVGAVGGCAAAAGWKAATPAIQFVEAPRVAVPTWAPAAEDVMSSENTEPLEFRARAVKFTPRLRRATRWRGCPR